MTQDNPSTINEKLLAKLCQTYGLLPPTESDAKLIQEVILDAAARPQAYQNKSVTFHAFLAIFWHRVASVEQAAKSIELRAAIAAANQGAPNQ